MTNSGLLSKKHGRKAISSLFFQSVLLVLILAATRTQAKRHEQRVCLEDMKTCRRNTTCERAYKTITRKCPINASRCAAEPQDLSTCLHSIEVLRSTAFKEDDRCVCFSMSSIKRVKRCVKVYNTVFANPCYESGLAAREEAIKLAAVTMRAAVATDLDDVTTESSTVASEEVLSDAGVQWLNRELKPTTASSSTPKDEAKDLEKESKDVAKKGPVASEEQFLEIDSIFAESKPLRPGKMNAVKTVIDIDQEMLNKDELEIDIAFKSKEEDFTVENLLTTLPTPPETTEDWNSLLHNIMSPEDYEDKGQLEYEDEIRQLAQQEDKEKQETNYSLVVVLTVVGSIVLLVGALLMGYVYRAKQLHRRPYHPGKFEKKPTTFIVRSLKGKSYQCKDTTLHL